MRHKDETNIENCVNAIPLIEATEKADQNSIFPITMWRGKSFINETFDEFDGDDLGIRHFLRTSLMIRDRMTSINFKQKQTRKWKGNRIKRELRVKIHSRGNNKTKFEILYVEWKDIVF